MTTGRKDPPMDQAMPPWPAWELDKEYPLKCGGKMVPKKIGRLIEAAYIRPDVIDGGTWHVSLWRRDGTHLGFDREADPLLDVVAP